MIPSFIGNVTIVGAPGVAVMEGLTVIDLTTMAVTDHFRVSEQRDTAGDVVRVTPWDQQRDLTISFYPMSFNPAGIDLPTPMSKVVITGRPEIPLPLAFAGDWRYVGPGEITATNTGLMVMRLTLRRWNPSYGKTLTPT